MVVEAVEIRIFDKVAGYLTWDNQLRRALFSFSEDFPAMGWDIAPLEKSISSPSVRLPLQGNMDKRYAGLPRFIADSLPDRWGNRVFEAWAVQNNIPKRKLTPLDRLSFIGSRAMGALEFIPQYVPADEVVAVAKEQLFQTALALQDERHNVAVQLSRDLLIEDMYRVGTSAGGKRAKAIIAINDEGDIRSGQVMLPPEYKYYILKFNDADWFPFPEVEMAYSMMAREAGISMMPCRLIEIEGRQHFLTERFDRQNGEKQHILTLAAMSDTADSYEDLFAVMRSLRLPKAQQDEMFRRMVFNVLAWNVDDHSKNISFIMDRKGRWGLAPAYDLVFSVDVDAPDYVNTHSLSICGKTDEITEEDLLHFARMNDIRSPKRMIAQVRTALSRWQDYAHQTSVPEQWIHTIQEYLNEE